VVALVHVHGAVGVGQQPEANGRLQAGLGVRVVKEIPAGGVGAAGRKKEGKENE